MSTTGAGLLENSEFAMEAMAYLVWWFMTHDGLPFKHGDFQFLRANHCGSLLIPNGIDQMVSAINGKKRSCTMEKYGKLTFAYQRGWELVHETMTGWWFQTLWKIWKSSGMIIPIYGKIKVMFQSSPTRWLVEKPQWIYIHLDMRLSGRVPHNTFRSRNPTVLSF